MYEAPTNSLSTLDDRGERPTRHSTCMVTCHACLIQLLDAPPGCLAPAAIYRGSCRSRPLPARHTGYPHICRQHQVISDTCTHVEHATQAQSHTCVHAHMRMHAYMRVQASTRTLAYTCQYPRACRATDANSGNTRAAPHTTGQRSQAATNVLCHPWHTNNLTSARLASRASLKASQQVQTAIHWL